MRCYLKYTDFYSLIQKELEAKLISSPIKLYQCPLKFKQIAPM